jgi:hypothetical protein
MSSVDFTACVAGAAANVAANEINATDRIVRWLIHFISSLDFYNQRCPLLWRPLSTAMTGYALCRIAVSLPEEPSQLVTVKDDPENDVVGPVGEAHLPQMHSKALLV